MSADVGIECAKLGQSHLVATGDRVKGITFGDDVVSALYRRGPGLLVCGHCRGSRRSRSGNDYFFADAQLGGVGDLVPLYDIGDGNLMALCDRVKGFAGFDNVVPSDRSTEFASKFVQFFLNFGELLLLD